MVNVNNLHKYFALFYIISKIYENNSTNGNITTFFKSMCTTFNTHIQDICLMPYFIFYIDRLPLIACALCF